MICCSALPDSSDQPLKEQTVFCKDSPDFSLDFARGRFKPFLLQYSYVVYSRTALG
jgi:hypothetical protein